MPEPTLSAAFWDYDRTRRLADGRVRIDGYELDVHFSVPEATFARAKAAEFDISELSFSNSVTQLSQRPLPYVLIPVFLSRAFRHSTLYIRRDRGISRPADLRGKTIGVQEYDMTAAIVVRGFLRDQFGVMPEHIHWKIGEAEGGNMPAFPGEPPAGVQIDVFPPGASLDDRLLNGELDAIIVLRPSRRLAESASIVARLFENSEEVERQWFEKSRYFPIMHVVGVRNDAVARDPALPGKVFDAFLRAKQLAIDELETLQSPKVTIPWPHAAIDQARNLMGADYWPYGVTRNRGVLEAQLQWSWLDGLQARRLTVDELFHPSFYNDGPR